MCKGRELGPAVGRLASVGLLCGVLATTSAADAGQVNLELRPVAAFGETGQIIEVELYAVHDHPADDQLVAAIDVVFSWDPAALQLLGLDTTESVPLLASVFPPNDLHGVNEEVPPQDGDGYYLAFALPAPGAISATPEGALITTFRFLVLGPSEMTTVAVIPSAGADPGQSTIVWDGSKVNNNITGTLGSTDLRVGCPGDTDGNGVVDVDDLLNAILDWDGDGSDHNSDVTNDGVVNVDDLLAIILTWGPCL